MLTWTDITGVADITGVTVSQTQLNMAQSVIDIYSNRTVDASGGPASGSGISKRDLTWLKQALAWQAVWMPGQAGYATRTTVSSVSQDGQWVQYRSQSDQDLAPLASRALRNLSWKTNRTTRTPELGMRPRGLLLNDFTQERSDDFHGWTATE